MAEPDENGRTPEAKAFRAERVLEATRELASAGGYEAVQMREVARRANVALATLYRYYPSKDALLVAAMRGELAALRGDVRGRRPRERTPGARAAAVFIRAFRAIQRDRGFAHAAASTYHIPRPLRDVDAGIDPLRSGYTADPALPSGMAEIAAEAAWGPDHEPTAEERLALHVLEALWNTSLIDWLNRRITAEFVEKRLRFAAGRLLLDIPQDSGA